jgi:hypothetical protein
MSSPSSAGFFDPETGAYWKVIELALEQSTNIAITLLVTMSQADEQFYCTRWSEKNINNGRVARGHGPGTTSRKDAPVLVIRSQISLDVAPSTVDTSTYLQVSFTTDKRYCYLVMRPHMLQAGSQMLCFFQSKIVTLSLGPTLLQLHWPRMQPQPVVGIHRQTWLIVNRHNWVLSCEFTWTQKCAFWIPNEAYYRALWISKHCKCHVAGWSDFSRWSLVPARRSMTASSSIKQSTVHMFCFNIILLLLWVNIDNDNTAWCCLVE